MTVAEFFDWTPPDGGDRWELADGIPRAMAPASPRHGAIQAETAALLSIHLAKTRPECRVVIEAGVRPGFYAEHNLRVPDLGITCGPWADDERILSAPLVLVEILSPSNEADTRNNILNYTTITGLAEILVVHSTKIAAELYRRKDDGNWPLDPKPLFAGDAVVLESIGFSVPLMAFYRTSGLAQPSL
jgi:Uma2 family endonuclease